VLLRTKFSLLIAMLSLTVVISLGVGGWSVALLQRELSDPYRSIATTLSGLRQVRAAVDGQLLALNNDPATPATLQRFEVAAGRALTLAEELESDRVFVGRVGLVSARTLRQRAEQAAGAGRAWLEEGDAAQRAEATTSLQAIRGIVDMLDERIFDDAQQVLAYSDRIRLRMLLLLGAALAGALLLAVLSLVLFRRWVITPVARLRTAADRIGHGDFTHRIPVEGRDELAQLSDQVNRMAGTVLQMQDERVERERLAAVGEMLRRLSHNIRNPLSGIRGVAEIAHRRLDEDSPLHEHMRRIINTVDRLDSWLRDLLRSSSPLALHPEEVDVRAWLADLLDTHRLIAATKNVDLEVCVDEAPREAVFDRRHLEQAVTALVTNAIQASQAGGRVRVSARSGLAEDADRSEWTLEVADEGPGIPHEVAGSIFQPHFTTKPDGSGMGLAIARQVVQGHGGSIHLDTDASRDEGPASSGWGAVFRVELPLHPIRRASAHEANGAHSGENSRH